MKIVMVGGQTRNIGKTSVIEGIISRTPHLDWTAVKITQFGHGICSIDGDSCECQTAEHQFVITTEQARDSGTDSSRFLAAGAKRSLWVRTRQGDLFSAIPSIKTEIERDDYVIVESNSLRRFIKPELYLQVVHTRTEDFKQSAQQFFDLADGFILVSDRSANDTEEYASNLSASLLAHEAHKQKPIFSVYERDRFISDELMSFVQARLSA